MDSKTLTLTWIFVSFAYGLVVAFVYDATWFVVGFAVLLVIGWLLIGAVARRKR